MDSEILPGNNYNICRKDRTDRTGGGVLLAVCDNILSIRRNDLESQAEMLVCEIRPNSKKKIEMIVFYRPPDLDLNYIKQLKESLQLIQRCAKFDRVIICGDFNLPNIDWTTGMATNNSTIYQHLQRQLKIIFYAS